MGTPYIIPFNHQPVADGVTTSTYTVPAEKYARVSIASAKLPVLNSVALYYTTSTTSSFFTVSSSSTFQIPFNCSRYTLGLDTNTTYWFNYGTKTVTNTDYMVTFFGTSYSSPIGSYTAGQSITILGTGKLTSISCVIEPESKELWLKAGDVLSFSAGAVFYEEYNVIE